jgi:hypothetical protein
MKICFRIGAEQDGSQQPKPYRSVRVKAQLLRPKRFSGARACWQRRPLADRSSRDKRFAQN